VLPIYDRIIVPLGLHIRYYMTFIEWRCIPK